MDYTQNLHLPQWEETDRIQMDDFNDAFSKIDTACAGVAKIEFGSYVGTGEYGSSHPNSLTFSFQPKVVLIGGHGNPFHSLPYFWGDERLYIFKYNGGINDAPATLSGNTMSWYSNLGADFQYNAEGRIYPYVAIG